MRAALGNVPEAFHLDRKEAVGKHSPESAELVTSAIGGMHAPSSPLPPLVVSYQPDHKHHVQAPDDHKDISHPEAHMDFV